MLKRYKGGHSLCPSHWPFRPCSGFRSHPKCVVIMKPFHNFWTGRAWMHAAACLTLWVCTAANAATTLALWDTYVPLADNFSLGLRTTWKAVPGELLRLESNPVKAMSDPGYYGREYAFKGDAVVETPNLIAVFWSAKGRVLIYSKEDGG